MRRFDMRLPASVRLAGNGLRDLLTETQNVSARGVFFYLDRPLAEGSRIEVTMTFPPHVTLTEPVRVRFTARVVRVENSHRFQHRRGRHDRRVRVPALECGGGVQQWNEISSTWQLATGIWPNHGSAGLWPIAIFPPDSIPQSACPVVVTGCITA